MNQDDRYLSALHDVEEKLLDLRKFYGSKESTALNKGIASDQDYWSACLRTIDTIAKFLDKLRVDQSTNLLFKE